MSAGLVVAAAIGRSRSQLSVCSLDGVELAQVSHDQEIGVGPDVLMPVVVGHLTRMLAELGRTGEEVVGVGLSLPGTVDPVRVVSVDSPALAGWDGIALAPYLREVTGAPLVIDNDCNVMALSERDGHLRDHDDVLVLKASTGLGAARSVVRESGRRVGEALAATVTVLNPRAIVVGGDMAGAFDTFAAGLRDTLFPATTALAGRDLQVLASTYGERAGLVGCVRLALEAVLSPRTVDAALAGRR